MSSGSRTLTSFFPKMLLPEKQVKPFFHLQKEGHFKQALPVLLFVNSSSCLQLLRRNFSVSRAKSVRWHWGERSLTWTVRQTDSSGMWCCTRSEIRLSSHTASAVYLHLPFPGSTGTACPAASALFMYVHQLYFSMLVPG